MYTCAYAMNLCIDTSARVVRMKPPKEEVSYLIKDARRIFRETIPELYSRYEGRNETEKKHEGEYFFQSNIKPFCVLDT